MSAAAATQSNGHDARLSELLKHHAAAMKNAEYLKAYGILQQVVDVTQGADAQVPATIASVISDWKIKGPLVHEPTGIAKLDELTGGGPVYGTRWYCAGAPDAGKTALLVQFANVYLDRGIAVGLLAVDEDADDLVTRLAQRIGYARHHCETRDPRVLSEMLTALEPLSVRLYDDAWTIESAAADLAQFAAQRGDARAMLGVDSLQTVRCDAEATAKLSGRELSTNESVTARTRAVRAAATRHRMIAFVTSELSRGTYGSPDPDKQTPTLAGGKWSGSIEYGARVLLGLRNVAGEKDVLDLEIAKNKHGPRDEHVFLRIDRRCQTLTECGYEPAPAADREAARTEKTRERVLIDAIAAARVLKQRPGLKVGDARAAVRQVTGIGNSRLDLAFACLGSALVKAKGSRCAEHISLNTDLLPTDIRTALEAP